MAIEEALIAIDESWVDIEPRLTTRELVTLANIDQLELPPGVDRLEAVFELLAAAIPPDSPAWPALRSSSTRFQTAVPRPPAELAVERFIQRARDALSRPSILDDFASDYLVDAWSQELRRLSIRTRQREPVMPGAVGFAADDGMAHYPRFQFVYAGGEPVAVHTIVSRLHEQLGGDQDPLGVFGWWLTPNAWLGQAPAQLLGLDRDADIEYAAAQLDNDNW